MLRTRNYREVIQLAARMFGFPHLGGYPAEVWLEAMILQESSGNPHARRYELALDRKPDQDVPLLDDLLLEDDASYGLMQVLGSTYKEVLGIPQGTTVSFSVLENPIVNIGVGCIYLSKLMGQVNNDAVRALCRYNGGGRGDELVAGRYRRQEYPAAILARCPGVEDDWALKAVQG